MEKNPKVRSFPIDEYPATRPKIGTASLGLAMLCALLALYYWPAIKLHLGL